MPARADVSDKLIHFTKGSSWPEAFDTLRKITNDRRLIAGTYMIRGGYPCVCFTEAPLAAVSAAFLNDAFSSRYAPFGLMFDKSAVFDVGGRPVIYQPEDEYSSLPEVTRWRHVRFDLAGDSVVDFTWEREWRVRCDEFTFAPQHAVIVVPDYQWGDALVRAHRTEQRMRVEAYSTVLDHLIAEQFCEDFSWRVVTLR
jgi:hypothetical protein